MRPTGALTMTDDPCTPDLSRRGVLRSALATTAAISAPLLDVTSGAAHAAANQGGADATGPASVRGALHTARGGTRIGALSDQSAVRTFTVGDTRLTYVVDGAMELDPAGFLPAVPAEYWQAHPEALTGSGRIAASAGGVLVERGRRRLLIDVGLGGNVLSPSLGISRGGALLHTLGALRVSPESIDTVAFTHLHTDHTGLGFLRDRNQELHKAFPRADYLVAGAEWEPFWQGEIKVGAPSWDGFMVPMSRVLQRFDDGDEVWPGVTALITPGHSPGHTTYVVSASGGRRILVLGDAFHTPAQMTHPEWPSGPDVDIEGVLHARTTLLKELLAPRTYAFAFHFGDTVFGRVVRDDAGNVQWQPAPARELLPAPVLLS
ncbi:MBL fold metallo-hydrolase [Streptomyces sp. NPDC051172]|uniref:MBL fold metallo-hydrolase n=1 Tax=Streptomyces sp. NPDC051172 TaxID=3155796 RepID=UPI00344A813A